MSLASAINLSPSVFGSDGFDTSVSSTNLEPWTPTSAINNTNVNVSNGATPPTTLTTLPAGLYLITGSCNVETTQIPPSTSAQSLAKCNVSFINTSTSAVLTTNQYQVTPAGDDFPATFYCNLTTFLDLQATTPIGLIVNSNSSSWDGSAEVNNILQYFQVIQLGN